MLVRHLAVSMSLYGHTVLESRQGVLAAGSHTLQTLASTPTLVISVKSRSSLL